MEQEWKLERLISAGLQIEFGDYLAVENWLYEAYMALSPFPGQRNMLRLACSEWTAPEEMIQRGLEILNEALDRSRGITPNLLVMPNTGVNRSMTWDTVSA